MAETTRRRYSIATLTAAGFALGCTLLFVAFFLTFTICADTTYAKILFPFAVFAAPGLLDRWWFALFVGLIQYPAYFALIALVRSRRPSSWELYLIGLVILHLLGIWGATAREKSYYERRWRESSTTGAQIRFNIGRADHHQVPLATCDQQQFRHVLYNAIQQALAANAVERELT